MMFPNISLASALDCDFKRNADILRIDLSMLLQGISC